MPNKLIGTAPNQVPVNGMLGNLAFQNKESVEFYNGEGTLSKFTIEKISNKFPVTAKNVFIYDTRKDSDGGAWRKHCSHLSWYNEELNTATRGSRRDFPSVAIIISETNKITILDGDDSDTPMWMVFTVYNVNYSQGSGMVASAGYSNENFTVKNVSVLNGQMFIALSGTYNGVPGTNLSYVNFINDIGGCIGKYTTDSRQFVGTIAQRNKVFTSSEISTKYRNVSVGNYNFFEVGLTVLPNAPIDPDTNLPMVTIVAGHMSGISVITHDLKVFTISSNNWIPGQGLKVRNTMLYGCQSAYYWYAVDLRDINNNWSVLDRHNILPFRSVVPISQFQYLFNTAAAACDPSIYEFVQSVNNGYQTPQNNYVQFCSPVIQNSEAGMTANVSPSFNSGWLPGNCLGAWLCDNRQEILNGAQDFSPNPGGPFSSTAGWIIDSSNASGSTLTVSSGDLVFTHSPTNNYWDGFETSFDSVPGKFYVITFNITSTSGGSGWNFRAADTSGQHQYNLWSSSIPAGGSGIYQMFFEAKTYKTYLHLNCYSSGCSITVDYINIREGSLDASPNGRGLQAAGNQINKTPVAYNADLVAYSNFSNSNYLWQRYNSNLDVGTGDFSIIGWVKSTTSGNAEVYFARGSTTVNVLLRKQPNNTFLFYAADPGYSSSNTSTSSADNTWQFLCGIKKGRHMYLYVNGVLEASGIYNGTLTASSAESAIGTRPSTMTVPFTESATSAQLALWRVSGYAPSEEQVKKMYNDEKVLFTENAKATIYGSSNYYTAIAFDEDTKYLHIGTSSGRSVFSGLCRIDNTTTPVTVSISASNGLVVEQ